jgi:hypothetical protein
MGIFHEKIFNFPSCWVENYDEKIFIQVEQKNHLNFWFHCEKLFLPLSAIVCIQMNKMYTQTLFTPHDKHSHHLTLPSRRCLFRLLDLIHSGWEVKENNIIIAKTHTFDRGVEKNFIFHNFNSFNLSEKY